MPIRETRTTQALPWPRAPRRRSLSLHQVVVLLPLLVVGLFSIGYLNYRAVTTRKQLDTAAHTATSQVKAPQKIPQLPLTTQPALPTMQPTKAEDPATHPGSLPGSASSGFNETGAASALQNTITDKGDAKTKLQASPGLSKKNLEDF